MDSAFPEALLQKILKVRIAEINASYPKRGGQVREYYDNGHPKVLGKTKDDKPEGPWEWFHKDGTHMRTGAYKSGKKTGEWTTYAADGTITKVSTYK
jgi:antitoxin component YwqK of YwqJK toxin-antitoxin module